MKEIKNSNPELDPKKVEEYGRIQNDSDPLADREFVTPEGSKLAIELLAAQVLDDAIIKWNLSK